MVEIKFRDDIKFGDPVHVNYICDPEYDYQEERRIVRYKANRLAYICGATHIYLGNLDPGYSSATIFSLEPEETPPQLNVKGKAVPVYIVRFGFMNRPYKVLPIDLLKIYSDQLMLPKKAPAVKMEEPYEYALYWDGFKHYSLGSGTP